MKQRRNFLQGLAGLAQLVQQWGPVWGGMCAKSQVVCFRKKCHYGGQAIPPPPPKPAASRVVEEVRQHYWLN